MTEIALPPPLALPETLPRADVDTTALLGTLLGLALGPGDLLALHGDLGAGKTHLARALIRSRLGDPMAEVPSPSFTLVQTYQADCPIWHVDLYRLADSGELAELGLEDALDDAISIVEWPERAELSPNLDLHLNPIEDGAARQVELSAPDHPGARRAMTMAGFLSRSGWANAAITPLAGDASARRYLRLHRAAGGTAVVMDAPRGSCGTFIAMTGWLRAHEFAAPEILASDPDAGLLLLEDLGDDLLAHALNRPADRRAALTSAVALLSRLHATAPPACPVLDGQALAAQLAPFHDHEVRIPALDTLIPDLWAAHCADVPKVLSLRDYHAENIVWRGEASLGLLDYQDAVLTHPAYDLVSLLQDVRREITPDEERDMLAQYLASATYDARDFGAAYALLGIARNLRILGRFSQLEAAGKPRYRAFVPRTRALIRRNLAHPAMAKLADAIPDEVIS